MKVLHIVNGNDNGGATTQVSTLIEAQMEKNEVAVLCLGQGKIVSILQSFGIECTIMEFSLFKNVHIVEYVLQMANAGYLLHAHGLKPMMILDKLMKNAQYGNKKFVLAATIHSNYHKEYSKKYLVKFLAIPMFIRVSKKIDIVIVVSEEFREILIKDGVESNKIHYIENGISMKKQITTIDRRKFLKNHGIDLISLPEDTVIYGLVARIHPVKGIDILIDAATKLKGNFLILVAGDGDIQLLANYKARISELKLDSKFKFLGYIERISDFYQSIDVNLICSYSEALSYSALEGAYHSKPLVCTQVKGLVDVLAHEMDAFISPIGDAQQFSQYMYKFMMDRSLIASMGRNLNAKIMDLYNSDKMCEKYDRVYSNCKY